MASVQLIAQSSDMTAAEVIFSSGHRAFTIITHASHVVVAWINYVVQSYAPPANSRQVVGLHIERASRNGTIALLELCVCNLCLVYQLRHRSDLHPPVRLYEFLNDDRFCFAGVAVVQAMISLRREYALMVRAAVDLGDTASRRLQREDLQLARLDQLARAVLRIEIIRTDEVPRSVLLERVLLLQHIPDACTGAVFSYEICRNLLG
ncbi:uncharacterized protein LOC109714636 [Ananas comosus]|uniref:Uncharacterized protein LOC109714636 n=1 Tax=Ananas comosus TaxID=4615 RepID=A0A6P5FPC5_ANACO|nr:uncharacterized protein LOC109714636 [Ananas comosus]